MNAPSPFSVLTEGLAKLGAGLKAPDWLVDELQHRLVLFLNHVLMQEPEAQARLARQSGRVVKLQWGRSRCSWRPRRPACASARRWPRPTCC
ncbi:hypothetical protein ACFSTJ_05275 [Ottowia pentelensis]|uniref:hypothetical protein n=1 Tax=Ottowia pentelensis TaxID=511108 RepID=UPI0036376E86